MANRISIRRVNPLVVFGRRGENSDRCFSAIDEINSLPAIVSLGVETPDESSMLGPRPIFDPTFPDFWGLPSRRDPWVLPFRQDDRKDHNQSEKYD